MKKFIIENEFWQIFPQAKIGVIICNNITNEYNDKEKYQKLLKNAEQQAKQYLTKVQLSDNQVIKVWRDAFQKFKTKKGARSSIEALLKRVSKNNSINTINPLVDIYNSISLKYAMPCGGEDIDAFIGNIKLTTAIGNEEFTALGDDKNSPPYENEIIYKDDQGTICRCWNWRESVRTMITEETTNAFLCIELIDEERLIDFNQALKELAKLSQKNLGATTKITILDINNKETIIK